MTEIQRYETLTKKLNETLETISGEYLAMIQTLETTNEREDFGLERFLLAHKERLIQNLKDLRKVSSVL